MMEGGWEGERQRNGTRLKLSFSSVSLSLCFCLVDPIPNSVFGTKKTDSAMFLYFYMYTRMCICVVCVCKRRIRTAVTGDVRGRVGRGTKSLIGPLQNLPAFPFSAQA